MNLVVEATDNNFSQLVNTPDAVLVEFWAPWCAPCATMSPVLEAIANDYKARASVIKLNIDQEMKVAAQYNVQAVPTLFLFKGGKIVFHLTGLASKSKIRDMLDNYV